MFTGTRGVSLHGHVHGPPLTSGRGIGRRCSGSAISSQRSEESEIRTCPSVPNENFRRTCGAFCPSSLREEAGGSRGSPAGLPFADSRAPHVALDMSRSGWQPLRRERRQKLPEVTLNRSFQEAIL